MFLLLQCKYLVTLDPQRYFRVKNNVEGYFLTLKYRWGPIHSSNDQWINWSFVSRVCSINNWRMSNHVWYKLLLKNLPHSLWCSLGVWLKTPNIPSGLMQISHPHLRIITCFPFTWKHGNSAKMLTQDAAINALNSTSKFRRAGGRLVCVRSCVCRISQLRWQTTLHPWCVT